MEAFNAQNADMNKRVCDTGLGFYLHDFGEFKFFEEGGTLLLDFPALAVETHNVAMVAYRLAVLNETIGAFPREIPSLVLNFYDTDDHMNINPVSFFRESVLEILTTEMQAGMRFAEIDMGMVNNFDASAPVMAKFMHAASRSGTDVFRARGMLAVRNADEAEQIRGGIHALLSTVREFCFDVDVMGDRVFESRGALWASAMRANPRLETLAVAEALLEETQDVHQCIIEAAGACQTLETLHLHDPMETIPPTVIRLLRTALSSNPHLRTVIVDGFVTEDVADEDDELVWKAEDLEQARNLVREFHGLSLYLQGEFLGGHLTPMARALQGSVAQDEARPKALPRLPQTTVLALKSSMSHVFETIPTLTAPEFPTLDFFSD